MAGMFDNWMQGRPMGGWDPNTGITGGMQPGQFPPWITAPDRATMPVPLPPGAGVGAPIEPYGQPPQGQTADSAQGVPLDPYTGKAAAMGHAVDPYANMIRQGADMAQGAMGGFGGPRGRQLFNRFGNIFGMGGARFQPQPGTGPNYQQGQGWQVPRPSGWGMPGPYGGWGMPR